MSRSPQTLLLYGGMATFHRTLRWPILTSMSTTSLKLKPLNIFFIFFPTRLHDSIKIKVVLFKSDHGTL